MGESRRRSRISRKRKRNRPTAGSTSVHDLTDDLLELVLLGLDSPVCLVRAAATCKRWRRVVAGADDGAFLLRFRSLHRPQAIGTYYSIILDTPSAYSQSHLRPEVDPVFVPSSSSASASYGQSGLQLSLDFVPPPHSDGPRELVDSRGSRLLLLKEKYRPNPPSCQCCSDGSDYMEPDLIVCEPLTRQYQAIPPPNDRLVCILSAFLLDGDEDEASGGIGLTNFRVLLVLYDYDEHEEDGPTGRGFPWVSVFTCGSNGGRWLCGEKDEAGAGVDLPSLDRVHLAGRTGGRIYWVCTDFEHKQVMVLDERTLQFSTMDLSGHMMNWEWFEYDSRDNFRVVGGGDGTVRVVHLTAYGDNLEVFRQRNGCRGTDDWELEMRVQLEEASRGLPGNEGIAKIVDAYEGLVVLSTDKTSLFSVDLETMEIKREQGRKQYTGPAFPYTLHWPPVMRACVENGRKRRKRRRKRRKRPLWYE